MNDYKLRSLPNQTEFFNRALRYFWVYLIGLAISVYYAWLSPAWQVVAIAATLLGMTGVAGLGIVLIKQNKQVQGAWLLVSMPLVMMLVAGVLVANIGFGLAFLGVMATMVVARQLMPSFLTIRPVIISLIAGAFILILDQFDLKFRLPASEQSFWIILGLSLLIILVYLLVVAREFKTYSLRTKLIAGFILISAISVAAVALFSLRQNQQNIIDNANQRLFSAATQTAAAIDAFIQTNLNAVSVEARLPEFVRLLGSADPENGPNQTLTLYAFSRKDPQYLYSYALLDARGKNLSDTSGRHTGRNEADNDYFTVPRTTGKPYVSPITFSDDLAEPVIYFSAPINNPAGQFVGVLRVVYRAGVFQSLVVKSTIGTGEGSFAVLFDENGLVLADSNNPGGLYQLAAPISSPLHAAGLVAARRLPDIETAQSSVNLPELAAGLANADANPFFSVRESADSDELNQVAVVNLETQPWRVGFAQPQEVFLAPVRDQVRVTILLAVLVVTLGTIIAVILARQLTQPIINLTGTVQRITAGDLSLQASVETRDETGLLAEAFNSMTGQLRSLIDSLESQVQERTNELALSIEVGQRAAAIRSLDELLPAISAFIRNTFDLYYVQIYFVDDLDRNLVIRAAAGAAADELLAQRHSLPIGAGSIVGQVAATGQPIVVSDTSTSVIHKPNPYLPRTRSELAIPLKIEGRVVAVLDMQSDRVNTFTRENLPVFEAMATQLAISIDSAQQWALAQEAQQKLEAAVQRLTRESWAQTLAGHKGKLAYRYNLVEVLPDEKTTNGDISAPLLVQNQPIGRLSVAAPQNKSLTEDEQALVQAVAQQLSLKAETLRLFEATQQQATREQLARQIADKIRASRDIESALKTAARELSQALGLARAEINLRVEPASPARPAENDNALSRE